MKYKEIFDVAEKRMDELLAMEPAEALKEDIVSVMEILLDAMKAADEETGTAWMPDPDRVRILKRVKDGAAGLMETALYRTNEYRVNVGMFVFCEYRRADRMLKEMKLPPPKG